MMMMMSKASLMGTECCVGPAWALDGSCHQCSTVLFCRPVFGRTELGKGLFSLSGEMTEVEKSLVCNRTTQGAIGAKLRLLCLNSLLGK